MHRRARRQFKADPTKCYQRVIREMYGAVEGRSVFSSLVGAEVVQITNEQAAKIILKYEWLGTMATGTFLSYGLFVQKELVGAVCFSTTGSARARNICRDESLIEKTVSLSRGACAPHAPKNSASFLVRHACRLAYRDYGYCVFFAYSDEEAGEIGTIYQAVGWKFLGVGLGRKSAGRDEGIQSRSGKYTHMDFISPKGERITSHSAYGLATRLGWTPELGKTKRDFLRSLKYRDRVVLDRSKWVWFEGKDKHALELQCRFPFLPYPKRQNLQKDVD